MNPTAAGATRLPSLDLLRFAGIVAVLLYHYGFRGAVGGTYLQVQYPEIGSWSRYGFVAINLFFLISGFVIPLTAEANSGLASRFVASRIARLYPAFWVAATLTFLVVWNRPAPFGVSATDYLFNLSIVPAWFGARPVDGVYWTLASDVQFYAYIVGFLVLLKRHVTIDAFFAAWLAILVSETVLPDRLGWLRLISLSDWAGSLFVAGAVFYRAWRDGWTVARIAMSVMVFACATVVTRDHAQWISTWTGEPVSTLVAMGLNALLFAIFALLSVRRSRVARGGSVAIALGAITYPLYLIHQKIGYLLIDFCEPLTERWVALGLAVATVALGAFLLHTLVERPCNRRVRAWLEVRLRFLDVVAGDAPRSARLPPPAEGACP